MKLTTLEKLQLEKIETLANNIGLYLTDNSDDLSDFECSTEEEDEQRILQMMRREVVGELINTKLVELIDNIEDFRQHRKTRQL
ncbi:hypothetical protein NVP1084O_204 [Vibrio phage 1.084.O._10N.261.49.F5]|nr:hypothetical protein NVP1084O_204 [Vibrio phage 1.084.O._10N.261.49.F5]